jgi:hypothetical protein
MQVIIEEVVSQVRTLNGGAGLSQETIRALVDAVLAAVDERQRHRDNVDEEHSLHNYHQRNQPWNR